MKVTLVLPDQQIEDLRLLALVGPTPSGVLSPGYADHVRVAVREYLERHRGEIDHARRARAEASVAVTPPSSSSARPRPRPRRR